MEQIPLQSLPSIATLYLAVNSMTSYFSEVLRQLMQQNGLRSAEFCSQLHLSKSYFSKIKNGAAVPQDFTMVADMTEILQLNPEERKRLFAAYTISRFGLNYQRIESAMQAVTEAAPFSSEHMPAVRISLSNGGMLQGKATVLQALRQLLCLTTVGEELLLSFQPEDEELMRTVQNCVTALPAEIPCKWQLFLHARQGDLTSAENTELFSRCLPLLLICRLDVRYQYAKLDEFFLHQKFPYRFCNGRDLLLITQDCNAAVYFQDAAMVKLYEDALRSTYEQSELFCTAFQDLESFFQIAVCERALMEKAAPCRALEIYVVAKSPCIVAGIDQEEIVRHLTGNVVGSRKMAEQYYTLLRNLFRNTSAQHLFFSESGLLDLMESEEYYEFVSSITRPISKPVRYRMLQNVIQMAKGSSYLQYHMLRMPVFSFRTLQFLNLTSDGKGLFVFQLGERFVLLLVQEKSISSSMIAFLQHLQKSGMALGQADSLKQICTTFSHYVDFGDLKEE